MAVSHESIFDLVIIGAGFGGIGMAVKAKRANLSFIVIERGNDLGGTGRDNTYPGSGCDTPSHHYSYSFSPNSNWSRKYSGQKEIKAYLDEVVRRNQLFSRIKLNQKVISLRWLDNKSCWEISTNNKEIFFSKMVVSAVGQLNQPNKPNFPNMKKFKGKIMHTAEWDDQYELLGKEIIVVGNGASAVQLIPEVSKVAGKVNLIQRSPNWLVPKQDRKYTLIEKYIFTFFPIIRWLHRCFIYWTWENTWQEFIRGSNQAIKKERAIRESTSRYLQKSHRDIPLIPDYPLGCRRILLSDSYFSTLRENNVTLLSDTIKTVEVDGVTTYGGSYVKADCIILATGFKANDFLPGIEIKGKGKEDLKMVWKRSNGAEAHLGMAVPGFPNFFMIYGPNTNLGHNSIIFMIECQINYILSAWQLLTKSQTGSIEVKLSAFQSYKNVLFKELERTAWAGKCDSWYKTATNKIVNNWSSHTVKYWWMTRRIKKREYRI